MCMIYLCRLAAQVVAISMEWDAGTSKGRSFYLASCCKDPFGAPHGRANPGLLIWMGVEAAAGLPAWGCPAKIPCKQAL